MQRCAGVSAECQSATNAKLDRLAISATCVSSGGSTSVSGRASPRCPSPSTYHNRGELQADRGNYERTFENYKLATRLDPEVPEYYDSCGRAYERKGEQGKATAHFDKVPTRFVCQPAGGSC